VSVSSLIPSLTGHVHIGVEEGVVVPDSLLDALSAVSDPRGRRGVRHRFGTIVGVAVCAVLAGARSYAAIAECAADLPPAVRLRLGVGRQRSPSESTIRRCLQRVDHDQLDRFLSAWLAARARAIGPPCPKRVVAVDGTSARGAPHRRAAPGAPVKTSRSANGRVSPGSIRSAADTIWLTMTACGRSNGTCPVSLGSVVEPALAPHVTFRASGQARHSAACRRVADHRICRIEDEVFDLALGHERMLDHAFLPFSGSHIAYRRADTGLPDV
jgi:DDE_Tnp_1-associated